MPNVTTDLARYQHAIAALEASANVCTDPGTAAEMRADARFLMRHHAPDAYIRLLEREQAGAADRVPVIETKGTAAESTSPPEDTTR